MIEARIRKSYPQRSDAAGFELDVELKAAAGVTVLFGPSGAGKTLTLDAIAGFVRPDEGRILLDDAILFDGATGVHLPPQQRQCGYVFQNYALFPHMTLRQNLEFAAERRPRLERHRRVNDLIEKFRLADVAGRRPHEVSGGQKQRCSIARALVGAPRILLLDEPAQGLDAPLKADFYQVLKQVRSDFATPIVLVTHDLEECFALGDQMIVVRSGSVVQAGTPQQILDKPASIETAKLLGAHNLIPCEIRGLDPGRNTSKLRVGDFDVTGPYLPGHLIGDRVSLCVRPEALSAKPRNGKPGANQIPAELQKVQERPQFLRLDFSAGDAVGMLTVELPRREYEAFGGSDVREWVIEFPRQAMSVL
ncbi:MAG: ABC transporter ATP-binding protein [Bryobacteraceae bacterium]